MEEIIKKLKNQARESWNGETGESRAIELEKYLREKLKEYSNALNISQEEILKAWEKDRTYCAVNYYQECNQPSIKSDKVRIFDTVEDLLKSIGKKEFRCPACGGVSTNPYKCDSGLEVDGKTCDWKVYGLLGDLGKGIFVYVKEKMIGETMFMPLSWENGKSL